MICVCRHKKSRKHNMARWDHTTQPANKFVMREDVSYRDLKVQLINCQYMMSNRHIVYSPSATQLLEKISWIKKITMKRWWWVVLFPVKEIILFIFLNFENLFLSWMFSQVTEVLLMKKYLFNTMISLIIIIIYSDIKKVYWLLAYRRPRAQLVAEGYL